jgi:hypothetical protein
MSKKRAGAENCAQETEFSGFPQTCRGFMLG